MPTLREPDPGINAKLLKEKRRFDPEPLQAVSDSMRWYLQCMNRACEWKDRGEYADGDAASTVGQFHADSTGHPVRMRCRVEFNGPILRPAIEARR
jgi:hypothetical protein